MCGVTTGFQTTSTNTRGLSPRVRGHQSALPLQNVQSGSIPACAGSPNRKTATFKHRRVYPRVCGVTWGISHPSSPCSGLSPRVRGHPGLRQRNKPRCGSIPACAGSPGIRPPTAADPRVYPRVCGVTDPAHRGRRLFRGLSPRVRGHPHANQLRKQADRSIPACAGSPGIGGRIGLRIEVYPRVCGVTDEEEVQQGIVEGLSPRVRGHLDDDED